MAATGADTLVIATPWPQYRDLRPADLPRVMTGRTLLDPYRVLEAAPARPHGCPIIRSHPRCAAA